MWKKSFCSALESCFNMCIASDYKMKILHGDLNPNISCIRHTTDRSTKNKDFCWVQTPSPVPTNAL